MVRLIGFIFGLVLSGSVLAQTCTISGSGNINWNPLTTPTCIEGGQTTANSTIIVVPAGVNLRFDSNSDTWTGTKIQVSGTLTIIALISLQTSIEVLSGGVLRVGNGAKLDLGSGSGCGYYVSVEAGGSVDLSGTNPSERLRICNQTVAIPAGGSCYTCLTNPLDCSGGSPPYCEPASGSFTGPFTFTEDGQVLPIELLFFKAIKGVNKISLSWATATELNFDYFDIEKSSDGKNFQSIAKVSGHGTTNERQDYALDDEKPYIGKNYYRLKSVDYDGYTEYFNVVLVDFDGSKAFSITPNPSDGITFTAETNFVQETRAYVAIYSTLGSEIGRYEVSGNKSLLTLPVKLESGIYYAKYISGEFTATNRVVVR